MRKVVIAAALGAGCAAMLHAEALREDRDIKLSKAMVTYDTDGVVIASRATKGQPVISMPVTYRRTGILRSDITFEKSGKTFIRAGAHGFYAGLYGVKDGEAAWRGTPMWCFSEKPQSMKAVVRCARIGGAAADTGWIAVTNPNTKYLPLFAGATKPKRVSQPDVEEQAVTMAPDLKMVCTFKGWWQDKAKIACELGGLSHLGPGVSFPHPKGKDGVVRFVTPHGTLKISPDPADKKAVLVQLIPADPPVEQVI